MVRCRSRSEPVRSCAMLHSRGIANFSPPPLLPPPLLFPLPDLLVLFVLLSLFLWLGGGDLSGRSHNSLLLLGLLEGDCPVEDLLLSRRVCVNHEEALTFKLQGDTSARGGRKKEGEREGKREGRRKGREEKGGGWGGRCYLAFVANGGIVE